MNESRCLSYLNLSEEITQTWEVWDPMKAEENRYNVGLENWIVFFSEFGFVPFLYEKLGTVKFEAWTFNREKAREYACISASETEGVVRCSPGPFGHGQLLTNFLLYLHRWIWLPNACYCYWTTAFFFFLYFICSENKRTSTAFFNK